MSSGRQWLRGTGLAAVIALIAALMQGVRLPGVLDGPNLNVALGSARDPHLLTGWLDGAMLHHCMPSAPCVQHANLLIFALAVFCIGVICARRPLALAATAILAISPLGAALVTEPLGASVTIGVLLTVGAAIEIAGFARYSVAFRCVLAVASVAQGPAFLPVALVYAALGGLIPLGFAVIAGALIFLWNPPAIDPLAGPATLVAFGACLFIGGPILLLLRRYGALSLLADDGRAFARSLALAFAAVVGGLFSGSGDTAPFWLCAEAALLAGLVASVRAIPGTKAFERTALFFAALGVVQFGLFIHGHSSVTSAAIAYRGDDLRGMLAATSERACVIKDAVAERYVLADGAFLRTYPPKITPKITGSGDGCLGLPESTTVIAMTALAVHDWGIAIPLMQAYRDASDPSGVLQIEGGAVSPSIPAKTPTGRGAFGNQIDTPLGHTVDFTILTGYSYTPKCLKVEPKQRLVFSAATVPGSPPVKFSVSVTTPDGGKKLLRETFPASDATAPYMWRRFVLPVPPADCASFTFALQKGSTSNWMTFAGASIR